MKKYCQTHYGVFEDLEGCIYCPKSIAKQVVKAFKMTEARRWSNVEWPAWLNEAWNRDITQLGCLVPSWNSNAPIGSLMLKISKDLYADITWGDYLVCTADGELTLCDAKTFEISYECKYNQFDLANS